MIDPLKSIGIEKGKPFNPDDLVKLALNDAAAEARAVLEMKYEQLFATPYFDIGRWVSPAAAGLSQGGADRLRRSRPLSRR